MEKLWDRIRQLKIAGSLPKKQEVEEAVAAFSKKEWAAFYVLTLLLVGSTLLMLQAINRSFSEKVPASGGEISEGIVGTPRFINPILAYSDVDRDLVSLVYSGLMRKNSDGKLIPDLAEKYEVSGDGLVYTFTLKDEIFFQDNRPVTAADVLFTITKVKDGIIKSPRKANWDGVSVEVIDNKNIKFTLKQPHTSFLENATLGILPEHLWNDSPIELNGLNTNPIGSGPYQVSKINRQSSGIIESFELEPFDKFALGEPYVKKLTIRFYANEEDLIAALENEEVEQISSITPPNAGMLAEKEHRIESAVLPRVFGLFFNQSQNQIFTNKSVVRAIDLSIDKGRIVRSVLEGYAVAISEPIPPNMADYRKPEGENKASHEENLAKAKALLEKDGWKLNEGGFLEKTVTRDKKKVSETIEFSISTGNAPELSETAEFIKEDLAAVGIKVEVKTFEVGNLNQSVIRPRKYDALLFGQIINNESDLFAFWHSSQRKDPGLNVAMYTNAKVDKILEDAFITISKEEQVKKYTQFEEEIKKDMPAVFLYSPKFIYVVAPKLQGVSIGHITSLSDRFAGSYLWYIETNNVWKMFSKKN